MSVSSYPPRTPTGQSSIGMTPVVRTSLRDVENHVQVVCRLRPFDDHETQRYGSSTPLEVIDNHTLCVNHKEALNVFTFDKVCDAATTQEEFYQLVASKTVDDILKGFNGTIFAYGQTGAGKSYTMFGRPGLPGIIPRISHNLFSQINKAPAEIEHTVEVSCMEIYMEQIRDLFNPEASEFSVHEDKDNGVYVKGLSHAFVSTEKELEDMVSFGTYNRTTSPTHMNSDLSRSHVIVRIVLSQKSADGELTKSNLFLVDLAGSEKVDRTGTTGQGLEEAKKINLSLSSLGQVISSLADHTATHIPYRDSKLTRILQESLGGNSRTTLIINVSPTLASVNETISTLRFGSRAKKIKNTAHVNTEPSVDWLKARVKMLEQMNRSLELQLISKKSTPAMSPNVSLLSPRGSTTISMASDRPSTLTDDLQRKNKKIESLEKQLLDMKMSQVKQQHEEDLKLFKLENALHTLNDKLSDVELINENLRKHLLISEKIIESRDVKIDKLRLLLGEQQAHVQLESQHFDSKLRKLQEKLEVQKLLEGRVNDETGCDVLESLNSEAAINSTAIHHDNLSSPKERGPNEQDSPRSLKFGLNLRIVKPVRGGGHFST